MTDTTKLPESATSRFNEWRESGQSYKDPRDFVEGWHKDRLFWFIAEELARAKEEGTREERELIVKLQMIRLGIQVFNKSEQERDEEEKRGLVRRDGGRTMSAFSLIKQIDIEIKKLTKKD